MMHRIVQPFLILPIVQADEIVDTLIQAKLAADLHKIRDLIGFAEIGQLWKPEA